MEDLLDDLLSCLKLDDLWIYGRLPSCLCGHLITSKNGVVWSSWKQFIEGKDIVY